MASVFWALLPLVLLCSAQVMALRCYECGSFSKENGIIEACNSTGTSAPERRACRHNDIVCLKHVNGNLVVRMCANYCYPGRDQVHGGATYCCTMPDYCNGAERPAAAALLSSIILTSGFLSA